MSRASVAPFLGGPTPMIVIAVTMPDCRIANTE